MKLALTHEQDYQLALTDGPLDESTDSSFRDILHPLFAEPGARLIVDISGSQRINSEGLAALVRLVTDANRRGGRVIYAAPSPFVGEVLQRTKLEVFFEIAASRDDAAETLSHMPDSTDDQPWRGY